MAEPFRILDLGDRRVLETDGRQYPTRYSARVVRLLVERKGRTVRRSTSTSRRRAGSTSWARCSPFSEREVTAPCACSRWGAPSAT